MFLGRKLLHVGSGVGERGRGEKERGEGGKKRARWAIEKWEKRGKRSRGNV